MLLSQTRTTLHVREDKIREDPLSEPNDSGLKLSLSRAASLRGEEHLKVWGKGSNALTLSPGIHHRLGLSESRVMGDYPARFGEHFKSALVNGSPPYQARKKRLFPRRSHY